MRIGIDARPLSYTLTGIGFYLKHLLDEFQRLDSQNEYYLLSNAPIQYQPINHKWHKVEGHLNRKLLSTVWMQIYGAKFGTKLKLDLFWSPRHHLPLLLPSSIKTVLTVHDLTHYHYPETMAIPNLLAEKILLRKSILRSDAVITDSFAASSDIRSVYSIDAQKLHTIYPGVPDFMDSEKPESGISESLPEKYFLFVGTLDPRKNFERILEAFELVNPDSRNLHLLLVGGAGWKSKKFLDMLNGHRLKSNIHMTGYIPRRNLAHVYRHALCLLFPSLYEGFGFPILEAMSKGTPVITSNISSMDEIAGNAAFLVDPLNVHEIANAMNTIARNENLRKQLKEKGIDRAKQFSWKSCAQKILDVFDSVMN